MRLTQHVTLQNLCFKKSQMYSQTVRFRVEIWQPRIFGQPQAQLEVVGLRVPRFQGKEPDGEKEHARLRTHETLTYQPSSLPEGPDQCVVRVSSQGVEVRSRPRPKFKVTDSEAQVLSCNVSSLCSSKPEQKSLGLGN
jgi:hypothetical protein